MFEKQFFKWHINSPTVYTENVKKSIEIKYKIE